MENIYIIYKKILTSDVRKTISQAAAISRYDKKKRREKKIERTLEKEMASLILGTTFTSLWLLRSRPDQVHDECMRGDPPRPQFNKSAENLRTFLFVFMRKKLPLETTVPVPKR